MKNSTQHGTLYRQYRPQTFDEVQGQEHIVSVLTAAIKNKKIAHAYLFVGSRGTGKTSVARILARSLGVTDKDLYEMDAASHTGVDNIRELREGVNVMPFESPYKFYVVDECLTGEHLITLSDGRVRRIVDVKNGDEVVSTDLRTGELVSKKISNWFVRRVRKIMRIRTPQGTITCTPTHKLWVSRDGEFKCIEAQDVRRTDFLLSPVSLPHVRGNDYRPEQLAFLALIQCDGHVSKDSCTIQVEVRKDVEYFERVFTAGVQAWGYRGTITKKTTKRGTTLFRCYSEELKQKLIELGCPSGRKSSSIDILDCVFQAPLESIRAYIDACFCCEGDASFTASTRLYKLSFTSVSGSFSRKLQLLLKKFGIASGIIETQVRGNHQATWRINLTGFDLRTFQRTIGLSIERKARILSGQLLTKEKQDGIPIQVPLLAKMKTLGVSHSTLQGHGVYLDRHHSISRPVVQSFIKQTDTDEFLRHLRFRYEKILSTELVEKEQDVYDFTVEGTHTFLANGLCSSNCHMLSKGAWNAFLKTLEEPPAHCVFVLATTEAHKVPDTIQSRCEVYTFKQPTREMLTKVVETVAKKEGYALERAAAELVALLAEGSFRDALSILQKVLTVSKDKKIDIAEVESVTGAPRAALIQKILRGIAEKKAASALEGVRAAVGDNLDMRTLAKLLILRLRVVLLLRYAPEIAESFARELTESDLELAKELSKNPTVTSETLRVILDAYAKMAYAAVPHLPLELAIIDLSSDTKSG